MIYVRIAGTEYPATITGRLNDKEWDNRNSKAIKLEMPTSEASRLFVTGISWSIIQINEVEVDKINEETGESKGVEIEIEREEYDNSEYSVAGDIVDHRDGYVTVKMGKPTAEELLEIKTNETDELWAAMAAAYNAGVQEA